MYAIFDAFGRLVDSVWARVINGLKRFRDGPFQVVLFGLILFFTGLSLVIETVLTFLDRIVAWLEKAIISVFLLAMTGLTFVDYLRREAPFFTMEIEGGPNMAMMMMVWVGFLGASLATRRGAHLSVDASDRVLSPGAARVVKRFTALVAAGLCWKLMGYSWILTAEGLEFGDSLEGLWVWDFLVAPLNIAIGLLPTDTFKAKQAIIGAGLAFSAFKFADVATLRGGPAERFGAPILEGVGAILGGIALLGAMPLIWTPTLEFGDVVAWSPVKAGGGFPLWMASMVLPMAFGLMALRFFVSGVSGRFVKRELGGEGGGITAPHPGGPRTKKDMVIAAFFPGLLLGLGATLYFGKGALILMAGILLVLTGAPLFTAIGVAAVACVVLLADIGGVSVATDMFEATKKQELLAIPFFVLAGNIMTQGSLAERLIGVARAVLAPIPGGLGLATIFACVIFAAISGSSPVTVIAIGGLMFPMLVKDRYPESYATGVLASAGSLGIIIPPSIPMILYAIMTSNPTDPMSPTDLFLAGVFPGLFIAAMLMIYTIYRTRPNGEGRDIVKIDMSDGYAGGIIKALRRGILALLLPVLILGGIYGVLGPIRFTVNEAAAVAVVYALFVELFIHRELNARKLVDVLVDSGVMMGSLFVLIVLAIAFNKFLAFEQIPQQATEFLAAHVDSKLQFLILVNIFLLLLGTVMEILSAILIVAPLLAPIAIGFGIDPIHFGIIFIVNLELGYLTPPMGINLFVASTVFDRPIVQVIKAALPFLLLMLFCLIVIALFPGMSTWLPSLGN